MAHQEKKEKKGKAYGWEDEEDEKPERIQQQAKKTFVVEHPKKEGSGYTFIGPPKKPAQSEIEFRPAKKAESTGGFLAPKSDVMMQERDGLLEKRIMADYLQPGGVKFKLSKTEKQEFLFKVKNLDKQFIANSIIDCICSSTSDPMKTCKAVVYMETLLEDNDPKYKDLFSKAIEGIRQLLQKETCRSAHGEVKKIITTLTGQKFDNSHGPSVHHTAAATGPAHIANMELLNFGDNVEEKKAPSKTEGKSAGSPLFENMKMKSQPAKKSPETSPPTGIPASLLDLPLDSPPPAALPFDLGLKMGEAQNGKIEPKQNGNGLQNVGGALQNVGGVPQNLGGVFQNTGVIKAPVGSRTDIMFNAGVKADETKKVDKCFAFIDAEFNQ